MTPCCAPGPHKEPLLPFCRLFCRLLGAPRHRATAQLHVPCLRKRPRRSPTICKPRSGRRKTSARTCPCLRQPSRLSSVPARHTLSSCHSARRTTHTQPTRRNARTHAHLGLAAARKPPVLSPAVRIAASPPRTLHPSRSTQEQHAASPTTTTKKPKPTPPTAGPQHRHVPEDPRGSQVRRFANTSRLEEWDEGGEGTAGPRPPGGSVTSRASNTRPSQQAHAPLVTQPPAWRGSTTARAERCAHAFLAANSRMNEASCCTPSMGMAL